MFDCVVKELSSGKRVSILYQASDDASVASVKGLWFRHNISRNREASYAPLCKLINVHFYVEAITARNCGISWQRTSVGPLCSRRFTFLFWAI